MKIEVSRRSLLLLLTSALFFAPTSFAQVSSDVAQSVAVIGTGNVGGALGPRFAKLGYKVIYGSRQPDREDVKELVARTGPRALAMSSLEASNKADLIVLAVPWSAAESVVKGMGNLDGKIIIDVVNPLRRADDGLLEMAVDTSAAEHIQAWAPGARVVKAFSTMGSKIMADPAALGGPVSVALASDDDDALQKVRQIAERMGYPTVDVGPLRHARHLEGMIVLMVVPAMEERGQDSWEYYFRPRSDDK
jgi:predicted dinucleotide-binding enzyme